MLVRAIGAGLWLGLACTLVAKPAHADRPRPSVRWADPDRVVVAEPATHRSGVIFLNRCAGGCVLGPGTDDSRVNTSSLLGGTVTISEFRHGDEAWDAVVGCVAELYGPFGVEVTDVDPGEAPHFEAIVAGSPSEIGESEIGGLAPFACGVIDNAVTYSFANIYGSVLDICETVAQESAHSFGLEHEYLCEDPMTYLTGCGAKAFRDVDAPCGEMAPRECACGGTSQNSYVRLMREFAGLPAPDPAVETGESDPAVEPAGCSAGGGKSPSFLGLALVAGLMLLRRRRA